MDNLSRLGGEQQKALTDQLVEHFDAIERAAVEQRLTLYHNTFATHNIHHDDKIWLAQYMCARGQLGARALAMRSCERQPLASFSPQAVEAILQRAEDKFAQETGEDFVLETETGGEYISLAAACRDNPSEAALLLDEIHYLRLQPDMDGIVRAHTAYRVNSRVDFAGRAHAVDEAWLVLRDATGTPEDGIRKERDLAIALAMPTEADVALARAAARSFGAK